MRNDGSVLSLTDSPPPLYPLSRLDPELQERFMCSSGDKLPLWRLGSFYQCQVNCNHYFSYTVIFVGPP